MIIIEENAQVLLQHRLRLNRPPSVPFTVKTSLLLAQATRIYSYLQSKVRTIDAYI